MPCGYEIFRTLGSAGDPPIGVLSDITNLSAAELRRMRARERYALLSVDEKEARNKKAREKRQQKKEESQGGNQYGATVNGPHEDMSNLTTAELNRKLVQEWYTALTPEQKDDRNKKAREKRK
uniref:Uncharacterized protein n=1 Tax=Oryza meridionalis TaxID=40149 RepID=A0A0E0FBR7_9ORYZ